MSKRPYDPSDDVEPGDGDPEVDLEIDDLEEVEITETGALRFVDENEEE